MRKNNTAIIFGSLFFSCSVMAANGTLAPTVVPMVNGGQASIAISNTSPNLFTVPGDRIIAVNSLDGALTNNEQTASGGVVVATVNKKPFTFILETERGLNLSIQAVPREGAGRTIQLVSDLRGTGEEAGAWETSTPYESLLVTISQAVRGGKLPAGWYQVPVTKETLQAPAGLSSVADAVWTGNHLKMVRFAVENKTLSALNIRESDFWQPGTRAVMFSQPASQLLAGARMDVYVIRDGEGRGGQKMKRSLWLLMLFLLAGHVPAASADSACEGRFVNPITDICWSCIFPLSLGSIKVSQGKVPDTANPSMPIQICPAPPPLFRRIGLAIGYWEPMALTDVTRSPGCMVNLGFSLPAFGKTAQGTAKKDEKQVNGAFYHVHWYKYPLTYWLNIITSLGCLEGGDLDIAYLSEIDPTWTDSSLTTILNPEAVIFANPIAQGACAADAIASAFNMPLDVLFWCAGSQGSMYPFNGWVSNESSPLQSSLLVSERMAFKLHRQGMIMETIGKNNAVCNEYPSPILPKERWRYQMVNMYPDSGQCHPFGRSVTRWETGKNPPNTKKNFGYLMWRKRNCVFL